MFAIKYCIFLLFLFNSIDGYFLIESRDILEVNIFKKNFAENDRPKVGILAQEISHYLNKKFQQTYESYIAASYVKYVEGAGALPIPIWINRSESYYEQMLRKVNGVLLPGGATWFNQTGGYADAGRIIYKLAKKKNDNGQHFPIFGTCLGFELLLYIAAGNRNCYVNCDSMRQSLPLDFTKDFRKSRLFKNTSKEIVNILENEPVTANFHQFCTTEKKFNECHLNDEWRFMSYGYDVNGLQFLSTIEHKKYPFYGTQFHPEKNLYEWIRNRNISHTENAIKMSQYFADFLGHEMRNTPKNILQIEEENRLLIYNFPVTFTALVKSAFGQSYMFPPGTDYPNKTYINIDVEHVTEFS